MNVPFVDLQRQHRPMRQALYHAINRVMKRSDFILGEDVSAFEQEFASFCGTQYAVGVDCGLSALELALRAFDIGRGDEVILPANTFIATAAAVTFAGARPVLVDVDPNTYNIDVTKLEAAIISHTRAVIPVHLYGLPANMMAIRALADKHNLIIIEDACQAHGALYKGRRVGSIGEAGAFSFYPSKNLGGFGDGGMLVTDEPWLAARVRIMRNCGQRVKNRHELSPFNHRLDTLQAAILRLKLQYLDDWNRQRRSAAELYTKLLTGYGITTPKESPDSTHVYHLYVVRVPRRDALQTYLQERGVATGVHYPLPIHLQPFYVNDGFHHGQFPVTERLCDEVLSLPMFSEITVGEVEYVAEQVVSFFKEGR